MKQSFSYPRVVAVLKKTLPSWPTIIFVVVLMAVHFFLRIYLAYTSGFWEAEASYFMVSITYDYTRLLTLNHWDTAHPFLMYVLTRFLYQLAPQLNTLFLIRLLGIVTSTASIPIFFIAIKKYYTHNPLAPFLYTLWLTIHTEVIRQNYSARPYGVLELLLALALFCLDIKLYKNKYFLIWTNFLFIVLFYWDYASIWFFGSFYLLFFLKRQFRFILEKTWPFLLSAVIWLPIFVSKFSQAVQLEAYLEQNPLLIVGEFLGGNKGNLTVYDANNLSTIILLVCFAIAMQPTTHKKNNLLRTFFLIGSIFPIVCSIIIGFILASPILVRQNVFISLLSVIGLLLPVTLSPKKATLIFLFTLALLFNLGVFYDKIPYASIMAQDYGQPHFSPSDPTVRFLTNTRRERIEFWFQFYLFEHGFVPQLNNSAAYNKDGYVYHYAVTSKSDLAEKKDLTLAKPFIYLHVPHEKAPAELDRITATCPFSAKDIGALTQLSEVQAWICE